MPHRVAAAPNGGDGALNISSSTWHVADICAFLSPLLAITDVNHRRAEARRFDDPAGAVADQKCRVTHQAKEIRAREIEMKLQFVTVRLPAVQDSRGAGVVIWSDGQDIRWTIGLQGAEDQFGPV